jgi:DNA invertase Pin-like site-specific DNA recombinase
MDHQRAVIYARLSRDNSGNGESVATQVADARALAAARGWEVVEEYVDGSISAATEGKRPEFARMLADVERGNVDAIVGRNWDRMTRNRRDDLAFIEACERHHVHLAFTRGADIDLNTGPGQMVADILSMVARAEIREKSERQKRANLQRAQQGKFFGTRRPFAFEPDGVTVREDEAQAVKEAYESLLVGGSLREIARQWSAAGFVTPQKGNEWSGEIVSRVLRNPRLAGWRTYKGKYDKATHKWVGGFWDPVTNPHGIVRNSNGEPVKAEWPHIVEPDVWHAAQVVLEDPERRLKFGTTHPSHLLLSGVAMCSECGRKIESGGKRKGRSRYRCSSMRGCTMRESQPIDDYIELVVLERLSQPDLIETFRPAPDHRSGDLATLRHQASEIHARMDKLAEAYATGTVKLTTLQAAQGRADAELAAIEIKMTVDTRSAAVAKLVTGLDVSQGWQALSVEAKRGVIDLLVKVELLPPKTCRITPYLWEDGVRKVNPETVTITWR